jgi:ParB family transcriptional regulator, chromosome partitioning protein
VNTALETEACRAGRIGMEVRRLELDLHRLELRFASVRVVDPRIIERMARSIEQGGQIVPCIAVPACPAKGLEAAESLVLVDGYRRVAALRRLGRDTVVVECWLCDLAEALLGVLARGQNRRFAVLEEALLLRQLTQGQGLSQHEVARRCGRDHSWVTRRLQLLSALPDAALAAVRNGQLSSWAAIRVIAPLARATSVHADQLVSALSSAPLSTRQLRQWFEHYQEASHAVRQRMVNDPKLFIRAAQESAEQRASRDLRDGPEGACVDDLQRINVLIRNISRRLPKLCPLSEDLLTVATLVHTNFEILYGDIKRYASQDPQRDPRYRENSQSPGPQPEQDQSSAQAVA